jgi:hypothetical protein
MPRVVFVVNLLVPPRNIGSGTSNQLFALFKVFPMG